MQPSVVNIDMLAKRMVNRFTRKFYEICRLRCLILFVKQSKHCKSFENTQGIYVDTGIYYGYLTVECGVKDPNKGRDNSDGKRKTIQGWQIGQERNFPGHRPKNSIDGFITDFFVESQGQ